MHKRITFKSFVIFLVLFNILAIATSLTVFWFYLADYEAHLPGKFATEILKAYQTDDASTLIKYCDNLPEQLKNPDNLLSYLKLNIDKEKVFFYEGNSSDQNTESIIFACGDKKISTLTLKKTGERSIFGFDLLKISNLVGIYKPIELLTIKVPNNVDLLLNDNPVQNANITKNRVYLKQFYQVAKVVPYFDTYQLIDWYYIPKITAFLQNGQPCNVNVNKNDFTATVTISPTATMRNFLAKTVETFTKEYVLFTSEDAKFSDVASYLCNNTDFYKRTETYDNRWTQEHTNPNFSNLKVENFIQYDSWLYSCDITFDYSITEASTGQIHKYPSSYTCYLASIGNRMQVVDLVVK